MPPDRPHQARPAAVCRLNPAGLKTAQEWLDHYRAFWSGAFDRLEAHLKAKPGRQQTMNTTTAVPCSKITRMFDASPARVFDAWLVKEEWGAWIGPEGGHCDIVEFEPRVGGRYHLVMHMSGRGDIPVEGVFKVIDRPHRFSFTWGWALERPWRHAGHR